jgi:hypothetical protein
VVFDNRDTILLIVTLKFAHQLWKFASKIIVNPWKTQKWIWLISYSSRFISFELCSKSWENKAGHNSLMFDMKCGVQQWLSLILGHTVSYSWMSKRHCFFRIFPLVTFKKILRESSNWVHSTSPSLLSKKYWGSVSSTNQALTQYKKILRNWISYADHLA